MFVGIWKAEGGSHCSGNFWLLLDLSSRKLSMGDFPVPPLASKKNIHSVVLVPASRVVSEESGPLTNIGSLYAKS
jgi:hypothetical protein